uniref:Uncharacterized protein n=1 Tax=Anguilla anguilla TaxID=7936 RepID=A0A0E9S6M0_ANGAN
MVCQVKTKVFLVFTLHSKRFCFWHVTVDSAQTLQIKTKLDAIYH